jgi:hypothetical protein
MVKKNPYFEPSVDPIDVVAEAMAKIAPHPAITADDKQLAAAEAMAETPDARRIAAKHRAASGSRSVINRSAADPAIVRAEC